MREPISGQLGATTLKDEDRCYNLNWMQSQLYKQSKVA